MTLEESRTYLNNTEKTIQTFPATCADFEKMPSALTWRAYI